MEGEEAFAAAAAAAATSSSTATAATVTIASVAAVTIASADSASLLPPHDSDVTPVGSPEEDTVPDIQAPPSDDDHDRDPDHDHDQGHGPSSEPAVLSDDLKRRIIKQVEYYFSDENLPTDKYLLSLIKKSKEGFVPITVIASFRKMKKLIQDSSLIVVALRESSFLVVSSDGKNVKRLHPFPFIKVKDPKLCTVLVENLPEDYSLENIRRKFGEAGNIKNICIREPHTGEEATKGSNAERLISSKLHALVEYKTVEAAEKAVATFNDEGDWRNGMRVKLLKQMCKYGQRRQAWRGPDSEKNITGRTSDQSGDEKHNPSEHRDDIPYEEDAEHFSEFVCPCKFWLLHLCLFRTLSIPPRRKTRREVGTRDDQESINIVVPMGLAMELLPPVMVLKPQSHHPAQRCQMEPGDSRWDVVGLPFRIKFSS